MSLNDKRCKCPFAIKMNGDGCQYCQPQTAIDLLSSVVDDLEEESDQQDARSRRLEAENEALRKSVEELRGRWEYKDEEIAYCGVAKLNEYGMEGWELVCKTYGNGQSHHKFTFKRRVISSTFDSRH